jgi:uncharacterized protein (TIGR02217 family)
MSDVFPKLQGEDIQIWKQPTFKTDVFDALSGIDAAVMHYEFAKWSFGVPMQFLIDNEYKSDLLEIMSFFLAQKGRGITFLYSDTQGWSADNAVTEQETGIGDGAETEYQLVRTWAGVTEPVNNLNGDPIIYIDEVLVPDTDYTVSSTGLVTFDTAPVDNAVITWTGAYYYRVRFLDDQYKFTQGSSKHHTCDDLQFSGSVTNRTKDVLG